MIINKAKLLASERGLSLYRIAKDAKLSYPAVYNFFHDVSQRYDRRLLDQLCQALGCQISDLLEHVPGPQKANSRSKKRAHRRAASKRSTSTK